MDNVPDVKAALEEGRAIFGTIDTWLVWNLTGRQAHVTDITNAGRTLLMNIEKLQWEPKLLQALDIPKQCLPEIRSSSER
jgi:glycerol kinase